MAYQDKSHVQAMFEQIANRYDRMNRVMTFGQDRAWRQIVVEKAHLSTQSYVLDLAAGTGDIAFEIRRQFPSTHIVAADFALSMIQRGRQRPLGSTVTWSMANALHLPFPPRTFDAVVSGFLLRNVPDIDTTLCEQYRVLRPGGWIVSLDTSPPPSNTLRPFIHLYLRWIVPLLGRLITGKAGAYRYLVGSTLAFDTAEQLVSRFKKAGFGEVNFQRFMLGTIAIHWGKRMEVA